MPHGAPKPARPRRDTCVAPRTIATGTLSSWSGTEGGMGLMAVREWESRQVTYGDRAPGVVAAPDGRCQ